jgi:hypothetical protein
VTTTCLDPAALLVWSPWQPHEGCWLGTSLPNAPGLYRIRREGRRDLDYIGQTGSGSMTLRKRQAMLKAIYGPEMPYRDPHTVGPALWALRHSSGSSFEVSVAVIEGTTPWRKGLEGVAIARYRQDHGASPNVNFGRMPAGYRMSSGNNARLVATGKRFRGGPVDVADASHLPSIAPAGPLDGDPMGEKWCGHHWSFWKPILEVMAGLPAQSYGLYRIRRSGSGALLYIGEGKIRERLGAHVLKARVPNHRQSAFFADPGTLETSIVISDAWYTHQRLELETDLIAAHVLTTGMTPAARFLG